VNAHLSCLLHDLSTSIPFDLNNDIISNNGTVNETFHFAVSFCLILARESPFCTIDTNIPSFVFITFDIYTYSLHSYATGPLESDKISTGKKFLRILCELEFHENTSFMTVLVSR
jgi:hypothetical protein